MDGAGDELFAGSAFALDQDGGVARGYAPYDLEHLRHSGAAGDDVLEAETLDQLGLEPARAGAEPLQLERLADHQLQLLAIKGLGYVIVRAELHGLDRGVNRAERRYYNDKLVNVAPHDFLQEINAVHARHLYVGDDESGIVFVVKLQRRLSVGRGDDFVAGLHEIELDDFAQARVIVDQKDLF